MKKLICFFLLIGYINSFSQRLGFKSGDTIKYVGLLRNQNNQNADLRIWSNKKGEIHYFQYSRQNTVTFKLEGTVSIEKNGLPQRFIEYLFRNDSLQFSQKIESVGDSVIITKNETRASEKLLRNKVRLPEIISSPVNAILAQCALNLGWKKISTTQYGNLHIRKVGNTVLKMKLNTVKLNLYILSADSIPDIAHIWMDDKQVFFALMLGDGDMDFIRFEWKDHREKLMEAEFLASQGNKKNPSCGGGFGPKSCENSTSLCKLTTRSGGGNSFTLLDSGYSITSDGRGPYINNWSDVQVALGPIAGLLLGRGGVRSQRYFSIDLNHPVPGDISVPLGIVKANGWPGTFVPAGNDYFVEIAAQWYTEANYTQHSLLDIPIGKTVNAEQLDMGFYINGNTYVLQMGPQPTGHCFSDGTAIFGDSTTKGTITRETETKWIVDLPPGSIGRLFDDHNGDKNAINKGLYYVSLHYVIQR